MTTASCKRRYKRLEPDDGKLSSPVLRGEKGSNALDLPGIEYRPGAPLFTCPNGHNGNADLNASDNIGQRFFARYISIPKPFLKGKGVSLVYTAAGQDNRDGQVAPPSVSAVNYALNAVEATPQLLPSATIRGCA
jgi:hypothetical protein